MKTTTMTLKRMQTMMRPKPATGPRLSVILGLSLALSACTKPSREHQHESQTARYHCENNQTVQAAYLNLKDGDSFATLLYQGRLIPMHQAISGSGARYVADDEQNSYRWHTKGDKGILSFLAADHTAEEKIILRDCKTVSRL